MQAGHAAQRGFSSGPRGRGRGRGGGRGRGSRDSRNQSSLPLVPSVSQVVPGVEVSIVLKQDQATGREVQGRVQDVLTRGDHPRGIKVRLIDGRIGRVQRMASSVSSTSNPVNDLQAASQNVFDVRSENVDAPSQLRYRDARLDDEQEVPEVEHDLSAFVVRTAKPKKRGARQDAPTEPVMVKCPVCSDFEGDEAAVAHHVNTHFD